MLDRQPEQPILGVRRPATARQRVRSLLSRVAMLGLYSIGAFFICLAAWGFFVGLRRLVIFFGRIISYGDLALNPEGVGAALADLTGPFLFGAIGGLCWVAAKRFRVRLNLTNKADDVRTPVIYLRSFQMDKHFARRPLALWRVVSVSTEEEQLVQALDEIGRVVAIGKPGERLPRLGAQRIYVEDADWQQQIRSWFTRAALVVIQVPPKPTEGVTWEIEQSLRVVALDRLVFLVSQNARSLEWLNQKLRDHGLTVKGVTHVRRGPYGSPISGVVHFENGQAEFRALVKPPFFKRPYFSPIVPAYRSALRPVTTRITGSWRPLPTDFGGAFMPAILIASCVVVIAAGLAFRADQLEREQMLLEQRISSAIQEQSPKARQLFENGEEAALGAWLQKHFQNGLRYIPDEVALAQANLMRRLLAIAPPPDCAALCHGAITHPALSALLKKLGKQDRSAMRTWFSFRQRVLLESLKSQHAETFPVSEADTKAALAVLYEELSEKDRATYDRITADFKKASAEDLCWWSGFVFQGVEKLPEPSRSKLARVALGQHYEK
jgi:hypothetical protein